MESKTSPFHHSNCQRLGMQIKLANLQACTTLVQNFKHFQIILIPNNLFSDGQSHSPKHIFMQTVSAKLVPAHLGNF